MIHYCDINYYNYITFITASGTRSQVKKHNQTLLPYTIITNPSSRSLSPIDSKLHSDTNTMTDSTENSNINSTTALTSQLNLNSMPDQTLLAKARKARFDDLPNFSGHPSEDVERFLTCIKRITKVNYESTNYETLEIVRGKLTQSAGMWFDNHEHTFNKWSDFETAFRNRYFSTTIIHKKFDKLKQRKQLPDEPVTSYVDDVINLCYEIDPKMSDLVVIQYLMSGVNPDFKKELYRRETCMNSLEEFLKYVKIEQDLYDTFDKSRQLSIESREPDINYDPSTIPSFTATVKPIKQNNYDNQRNNQSYRSSVSQRNSFRPFESQSTTIHHNYTHNNSQHAAIRNNQINPQAHTYNNFNNCKICGRTNHRTIDCFYKRTTGCFNCGQNHNVRDCAMPPNFQ